MRAVGEVFEYLRISPVDVSERGEHVIVRVHLEASGRHSGVEVSRDEFHVFSFQGEVLRSFRAFTEEEAALGFAGVGREG